MFDSNQDVGGTLSVLADSKAKLTADLSNDSTSAASALVNASGMAVSGLLASNMVSSLAEASINFTGALGTVSATGGITVQSKDSAEMDAKSVMKAISSTTNDGGASLLGGLVDAIVSGEYQYTSHSGTQSVKRYQVVRVASDYSVGGVGGGYYMYDAADGSLNLGSENYADSSKWKRVQRDNASSVIPNIGNITGSDSQAFGGLIVRNDVRGGAKSFMNKATVSSAGDIAVKATEASQIAAHIESVVTSSGGSAFGTGISLAVSGTIATNRVTSGAEAYVRDSSVTTTGSGDLVVEADNSSAIDAKVSSSTESGDKAVGVTLAFNSLGWDVNNLFFFIAECLDWLGHWFEVLVRDEGLRGGHGAFSGRRLDDRCGQLGEAERDDQ